MVIPVYAPEVPLGLRTTKGASAENSFYVDPSELDSNPV